MQRHPQRRALVPSCCALASRRCHHGSRRASIFGCRRRKSTHSVARQEYLHNAHVPCQGLWGVVTMLFELYSFDNPGRSCHHSLYSGCISGRMSRGDELQIAGVGSLWRVTYHGASALCGRTRASRRYVQWHDCAPTPAMPQLGLQPHNRQLHPARAGGHQIPG